MSGSLSHPMPETPLHAGVALGPWRRADYMALPDSPRHELVFGRLHVSPSPSLPHQALAALLWLRLHAAARRAGGRAAIAPLDVTLADHSVVQPDVIYLSAARLGLIERTIEGPPDLLVEVLSPSNERLDRGDKLALYAASGVREVWLVHPLRRTIELLVCRATGDRRQPAFEPVSPLAGRYQSAELPEIELDLAALWADLDLDLAPVRPQPPRVAT